MPSGKMRHKISLLKRVQTDDGFGNMIAGGFAHQFYEFAEITPKYGTETVVQSRLQGNQPCTIKVRSNLRTRGITAAWRAEDVRSGKVYDIASPISDSGQLNDYVEFLAVEGLVDGSDSS